jgi:hypothetical protein
MAATAEMINKINSLDATDFGLVVNLVDYLAKKPSSGGENVFRKARAACQDHLKDEDELENMVENVKAERNASRN